MYSFEIGRRAPAAGQARTSAAVPRVVYWVGLSSLLADICAESVASALPIFLFSALQLSPLQVGFLDGLYQGGAALVRVVAAHVADRRRSNRAVALLGYALAVLARVGFLLAGSLGLLVAMVSLCADRIGKGIRTAPRDAIIAGHSHESALGAAFGVHRSMDAVGALLGPLIGAGLLWLLPYRFDGLFAVSLLFGAAGVAVFAWRVPEPPAAPAAAQAGAGPSLRAATRQLLANKPFMRLLLAASLLSTFTVSDGLVYLQLQREAGIDERYVPLMFALTAALFLGAAAPLGRLADAEGTVPVFLGGYALLALLYGWLAFWPSHGNLHAALAVVALMGVHYAATDGILSAAAARTLPPSVRATGLALLATAVGLIRIGASALYGWLWQATGQRQAMALFAVGMLLCCIFAATALWRSRTHHLSST